MATIAALSRLSSSNTSAAAADSVRHDDTRLSDARTPTTHTHAESDVTNLVADVALKAPLASPTFTGTVTAPGVVKTPQTITYAATITPDASTGDNFKCTATGALTINAPTNPSDGQALVVEVLASGAQRIVTLQAAIVLLTSTAGPLTIASGKIGFITLRYSVLASNVWVLWGLDQTV